MLFGAGILLFIIGKSKNVDGARVTDLYFRRLLWMVLFGVIHCYLLLWDGEILYTYGIVGMFAFSFRHLLPKQLITIFIVILVIATGLEVKDYFITKKTFYESTTAIAKKSKGIKLTINDTKAIVKWEDKIKESKATPAQLKDEITARSKGYWSIVMHKAPENVMA